MDGRPEAVAKLNDLSFYPGFRASFVRTDLPLFTPKTEVVREIEADEFEGYFGVAVHDAAFEG